MQEVRQRLASLENRSIDARFLANDVKLDNSLMVQYQQSRDEYLRRRRQQSLLQQLVHGKDEDMDEEIVERHAQVETELVAAMQTLRDKLQTLQTHQQNWTGKREDLHRLSRELQNVNKNTENDASEDDITKDVDEDTLQAEQQRLANLQARKVALQRQLESLQKEQHSPTEPLLPHPRLKQLQDETRTAQEALAHAQEIRDFYVHAHQLVARLSGVQVLQVQEDVIDLRILQQHDISIHVNQDYRLERIHVHTPLQLEHEAIVVPITDPDDLVQYARATLPVTRAIPFVVTEFTGRLEAAQSRLEELVQLQQVALTKMGGTEVVCSLKEIPLTLVLRLTDDCPILPGSVTVEQVVGVGWPPHALDDLADACRHQAFCRPTEVVQFVLAQDLAIPPTPKLPVRMFDDES